MKPRMIQYYMDLAERTAQLSRAQKLKVGAVIVTIDDCLLYGFNGTPSGFGNDCETHQYMSYYDHEAFTIDEQKLMWPFEDELGRFRLKTKPAVLHAESNALMKLAKSTLSGQGAQLFQTHAPCIDCAKLIYQAGISHVHYAQEYKSSCGVHFLKECGVAIENIPRDR